MSVRPECVLSSAQIHTGSQSGPSAPLLSLCHSSGPRGKKPRASGPLRGLCEGVSPAEAPGGPGWHGKEQLCGGEDQVSQAGRVAGPSLRPQVSLRELHRLSGGKKKTPRV